MVFAGRNLAVFVDFRVELGLQLDVIFEELQKMFVLMLVGQFVEGSRFKAIPFR